MNYKFTHTNKKKQTPNTQYMHVHFNSPVTNDANIKKHNEWH